MYTLRKEAQKEDPDLNRTYSQLLAGTRSGKKQKEDPDLNRTYSQLLACTRSGKKRRKKILT